MFFGKKLKSVEEDVNGDDLDEVFDDQYDLLHRSDCLNRGMCDEEERSRKVEEVFRRSRFCLAVSAEASGLRV